MSYRELRNFNEILKILGYPRIVSIENFRTPNFPLVLDILKWFIRKFDPEIELPNQARNPLERVELIQTCAQLILEKVNIKLNVKKLYQSNGHAVQELLKLANLLYKSSKESNNVNVNDVSSTTERLSRSNQSQIMNKINEIKNARKIASEITLQGADLYDMLTKEAEIRDERNEILSMPLQLSNLEEKLRESIKITQKNIESINYKIDNVASDESNLDQKIEQKKQELERHNKRFDQVQMTRPQFQDEFDKLESEFEIIYEEYMTKFCSLVYLEDKLDEYERVELEAINEREKKRKEFVELNQMTNDFDEEDNFLELNESDENNENAKGHIGQASNQLNQDRKRTSRIKVFGSTISEEKDDSFDESFNLDDNVQDDDEDNSDLDSDDELELMNLTTDKNEIKSDKKPKTINSTTNSDDDF